MVNNVWISAVSTDNISRREAIDWVNNVLSANLTKVEELATGAVYCQMTHLLFDNKINIRKVKFNPKSEPDILHNWKLLTTAWKTIGIDKPVDVMKLKQAKFLDNMEFFQWFYKFFHANYTDREYDAIGARLGEDLPARGNGTARSAPQKPKPIVAARGSASKPTTPADRKGSSAAAKYTSPPSAQVIAEMEENIQILTNERDFYFEKLNEIEILLKKLEGNGQNVVDVNKILEILYREADGDMAPESSFTTVPDGGENVF